MKKRILICLLLLVLLVSLVACDDDKCDGDHDWGEWISTADGHYQKCSDCDEESELFAHDFSSYTSVVGADYVNACNVCGYEKHTPIYPSIQVSDEAQNTVYLTEINQALKALDEVAKTSDIAVSMQMSMMGESLTSIEFACKNSAELYFEMRGNNPVIYRQEDGKIFSYTKSYSKYDYERKYVCDADDFSIPSESLDSVEVDFGLELDVSRCNILKEDGKYIIEAYACDIMGDDITAQLIEVYEELGLDAEILSQIVVQTQMEIADKSYSFTIEMEMVMSVEGQILQLPFSITTSIDYSDITEVDFESGKYTISPPTCIEEVVTTSNATDAFVYDGRYYRVQLEKGQYYELYRYRSDETYTYTQGQYNMHIYNEEGVEIKSNLDDNNYGFYNFNVIIPSDGLYYVSFGERGSSLATVLLIRCDYETTFDAENPKTFALNTSGVLEGTYDVENYVYTSAHDQLLVIKNTSDVDMLLGINGELSYIETGKEACVYVNKGKNQIVVCAKSIKAETNYSFECQELYNPNGTDMNNLEVLSEDWSSDFLLGEDLGKRYAKIHVEERGYYALEFKSETLYGTLYYGGLQRGFYPDGYEDGMVLEKGDHIIWMEIPYNALAVKVNVKYTFHSVENQEIDVQLPVCTCADASQYIALESQRYAYEQVVKYKFELRESSIIKYSYDIKIYSEDGKLLSINSYQMRDKHIKLPAGKYYCTDEGYKPKNDKVMIFILTDYTGRYFEHGNEFTMLLDTPYTVAFNYYDKNAYFNIKIEREGDYDFTVRDANNELIRTDDIKIYIFDKDMQEVYYDAYDLEEGEYYVVIQYGGFDDREYTFTMQGYFY